MPAAPKRLGVKPLVTKQIKPKDERLSSSARGYGSRWRKARIGFLAKHPLCCHCELAGRVVLATVVDHIKPHKGDMDLFWQRANWQPLCTRCHGIKTASEDGAFGNKIRRGRGG